MNKTVNRIISTFGDRALVELDNKIVPCLIRTKKQSVVTNDFVTIDKKAKQVLATSINKRENLFFRQNNLRQKLIAANIDHIYIVIASKPQFSSETLISMLASTLKENISTSIVLNKTDLKEDTKKIKEILNFISPFEVKPANHSLQLSLKRPFFENLNIKMIFTNTILNDGIVDLEKSIQANGNKKLNSSIAFAGQSGTGKSSIINLMVPDAKIKVASISAALNTGKHTTTSSKSYKIIDEIDQKLWLIDTPGIEKFGISHLTLNDIKRVFPEWEFITKEFGNCRFSNCIHNSEPECQIKKLLITLSKSKSTQIDYINLKTRLKIWLNLLSVINLKD